MGLLELEGPSHRAPERTSLYHTEVTPNLLFCEDAFVRSVNLARSAPQNEEQLPQAVL